MHFRYGLHGKETKDLLLLSMLECLRPSTHKSWDLMEHLSQGCNCWCSGSTWHYTASLELFSAWVFQIVSKSVKIWLILLFLGCMGLLPLKLSSHTLLHQKILDWKEWGFIKIKLWQLFYINLHKKQIL